MWILFYILSFKLLKIFRKETIFYCRDFILGKIHFTDSLQFFSINRSCVPINKVFIFNLKKIFIQFDYILPFFFLLDQKIVKWLNINFLKILIIQFNVRFNLYLIAIFKQIQERIPYFLKLVKSIHVWNSVLIENIQGYIAVP